MSGLSKSRILSGFQCEKNLYLQLHAPELKPRTSPAQQAVFDLGHQVGREAQKRFPDGVLIEAQPWEQAKAAALTERAMASGRNTIFEATFISKGTSARVDILHRKSSRSPWQLIEVKASNSVKEEHLTDVAIQSWILRDLGIPVASCHLMHINGACLAPDLSDLFQIVDITEEVEKLLPDLPARFQKLRSMLNLPEPPPVDIGPHCGSPYECPYTEHCWKEKKIPPLSVLDLPSGGAKSWQLYSQGILELSDPRLPIEGALTEHQQRMVEAFKTGARYLDRTGIATALESWKWPLHYLDFETIAPAIPRFPGTRPYQDTPFQFSCHVQLKPGGELIHLEYLHPDATDPGEPITKALCDAIASEGSVVSYNMRFEGRCMETLAQRFPKHAEELRSIISRLVDPWPVVKANVYDNGFRGSFSIKTVAPALIGQQVSYDGMKISEGSLAPLAFQEMISPSASPARRFELRQALLDYCKKDTLNMVLLVQWLMGAAASGSGD